VWLFADSSNRLRLLGGWAPANAVSVDVVQYGGQGEPRTMRQSRRMKTEIKEKKI
jgi:hypothetical protein